MANFLDDTLNYNIDEGFDGEQNLANFQIPEEDDDDDYGEDVDTTEGSDEETVDEVEKQNKIEKAASAPDRQPPSKKEAVPEGAYVLYKDKNDMFECEVNVEHADINDTFARLVLECGEWCLIFKGDIDETGKCKIPIGNLSIFKENQKGMMYLEVVVDNTIFVPWESPVYIMPGKKVSVTVLTGKSKHPGVTVKK